MTHVGQVPPASPLTGEASGVSHIRDIDLEQLRAGYADRFRVDITRLLSGIGRLSLFRDAATGLSFFHPMPFGDDAFYQALAQNLSNYYPTTKQEYAIARPHILPGARVLEVGAGFGHFRDHLDGVDYTGLEFNDTAIAQAGARGITLLREDVRRVAARQPGAYDVTCAFQVLEHVPDPLGFFGALVQLTRPGGRIIVSTPNAGGFIAHSRELLNAPPHHYTWWEHQTWHWLGLHFGLSGLDLHNTPIDEAAAPWAQMIASDGLARLLGVELDPVVDETPLRRRIDALAAPTAQIILHGLRHRSDLAATGHTTIAIFGR